LAGERISPPEAILDALYIQLFHRPPDERDTIDEPRLWRALEAQRLHDESQPFREHDAEAQNVMAVENPALWAELSEVFDAAAQRQAMEQ
jgi:hypothetical protein